MITDSTGPSPGTPVASSERKPFSCRVLKLEHPANVGPLVHIAAWVGLLAVGLIVPAAANWYLAVPLIAVLMLLNLSITIGVLHMHTHRALFVPWRVNRVLDMVCCVPAGLTAADMHEVHVLNHHRYNDGPGDVTSTEGRDCKRLRLENHTAEISGSSTVKVCHFPDRGWLIVHEHLSSGQFPK